jgi:hypothetical protein
VPFAKGVVYLGHDGRQRIVGSVAIPKTHGLEGVTQDTRKCLQPNFTAGILYAFFLQHFTQPAQCTALFWQAPIAMVNIMEGKQCSTVDGQSVSASVCGLALLLNAAHGQHQKIGAIVKGMNGRTAANMPYLAEAN